MNISDKPVELALSDIDGVLVEEIGKFNVIFKKDGLCYQMDVDRKQLCYMFPHVVQLHNHSEKFLVTADRKSAYVKLTDELAGAIGLKDNGQFDTIQHIMTNKNYIKIAEMSEFKDEYCLLFHDQIVAHFKTEQEMSDYCKTHPNVAFSQYHPKR